MPHYEKLLIQIVNMAHICENDMIQIKDMFQIVATWLQFSTEDFLKIFCVLSASFMAPVYHKTSYLQAC